MWNRLDRYVLSEMLGPLGLGFLLYTFLVVMQFLFSSAEMIIQRGVPAELVGRMLLYILPSTVVLTIPMSLLFAILIAVGRLAADSELIALRSSGISLLTLYRPILLLSAVLSALNIYLMIDVLPHGNHASQQLNLEILTKSVSQQIQPRTFYEEWRGKVLYVFEIPAGQNRWKGVFLADSVPGDNQQIIVAEWGEARVDEDGEKLLLVLEGATIHQSNSSSPAAYNISHHDKLEILLEDQFTTNRKAKISASKSVREMNLAELRQQAKAPYVSDEWRNLVEIQIHKNFAIPMACIVFGLLGLPLGFTNRRGGKGSGFALSIGVIMSYWFLISSGEEAARYGKMEPWLAMWSPNILLGILGLFLLVRRNRDKSLLLSTIDRWVRRDLWGGLNLLRHLGKKKPWRVVTRRRRRPETGGESPRARVVLRLPHLQLRFPNIMDRYVIRIFARVFILVLMSGLTIYLVADFSRKADDMAKNAVPNEVVVDYYKYLSLQVLYDISPIAVLVSTLMVFTLLTLSNEITAYKALGVSLYRLAVPVVLVATLIAAFSIYFQSSVLPASNRRLTQLRDQVKGRESARTYRRADRQWLFGQERYVYNYSHFDPEGPTLEGLQVFEFDPQHRLSGRLFTYEARYNGAAWILEGGWRRSFNSGMITEYTPFADARRSDYPETPDYFTSEILPPGQMRYGELQDYIQDLESRGQQVPELKVELYNKVSYPVISLVMALVALPFAFRLGRQGALYGIGLSVVLGLVFVAVFVFFSTLGKTGAFPPLLAVWSPSLVFGTLALYQFLGVST